MFNKYVLLIGLSILYYITVSMIPLKFNYVYYITYTYAIKKQNITKEEEC